MFVLLLCLAWWEKNDYFDSDLYNSTNTVLHFDGKDGNLF